MASFNSFLLLLVILEAATITAATATKGNPNSNSDIVVDTLKPMTCDSCTLFTNAIWCPDTMTCFLPRFNTTPPHHHSPRGASTPEVGRKEETEKKAVLHVNHHHHHQQTSDAHPSADSKQASLITAEFAEVILLKNNNHAADDGAAAIVVGENTDPEALLSAAASRMCQAAGCNCQGSHQCYTTTGLNCGSCVFIGGYWNGKTSQCLLSDEAFGVCSNAPQYNQLPWSKKNNWTTTPAPTNASNNITFCAAVDLDCAPCDRFQPPMTCSAVIVSIVLTGIFVFGFLLTMLWLCSAALKQRRAIQQAVQEEEAQYLIAMHAQKHSHPAGTVDATANDSQRQNATLMSSGDDPSPLLSPHEAITPSSTPVAAAPTAAFMSGVHVVRRSVPHP